MIGEENDLDRFGWIVQIYITVRMWIFIASNGTHKKLHPSLPLSAFGVHVRQRPVLWSKRSLHQLRAEQAVRKSRRVTHSDFNSLHGLEGRHIELAAHERHPYPIGNFLMQYFSTEHPRHCVVGIPPHFENASLVG